MSFFRRLKIPVVLRITGGLVSLLYAVLTAASYLGMFPDAHTQAQKYRVQYCESAAVGFSLLAEKSDQGAMRKYLTLLAERCPDIQSLGIRRQQGALLVETENHADRWQAENPPRDGSQLAINLYAGGKPWGT